MKNSDLIMCVLIFVSYVIVVAVTNGQADR